MSKAATHTEPSARRATTEDLLAAANLPTPIPERIAAIVRATRLWQSERADIARELIAHAHDALSAGRTPEDTAASLGDPATIAKLLRRSARRKRPWHWQARHRTLQAIGISILALIGVYAVLFVRFNTGTPSITHNYIAELNERNSSFTEDQHALPAYEALAIAWDPIDRRLSEEANQLQQADPDINAAIYNMPLAFPDDPGFDQLVSAHQRLLPEIKAAIAASRLPTLGVLYSDRYQEITDEHGKTRYRMLPPTEDPALAGDLIQVLLPWVRDTRHNATLIAFDAVLAARNNNPDRAAESLTAVFDTARLVGQEHTLIASLSAVAIQTMGETVLLQVLHDHPGVLTESHLTTIAHTAAVSGRTARDLDFETERRMFGDLLQRAYTDDGRGDGRLTPEGVRYITYMSSNTFWDDEEVPRPSLATRLTGPVTMPIAGSRRDQRDFHGRLIDLADPLLAASPGSPESQRLLKEIDELEHELGTNPRFQVVAILTPAFTRSVEAAHRSKAATDATLTTLAVHIHHQRTGRWPDTLAELTPHLLPAVPEDPFDPGRPIKYRLIDNTPHIYFVGANGIDNHATQPTRHGTSVPLPNSLSRRYAQGGDSPSTRPEDQGDWIVFPPNP